MTDKATINSKLYIVVNADAVTGTPLSLKQQFYLPPSGGLIGAVKQGTNITIGTDGTINAFLGPGFAVTSLAAGAAGTLRTGDIRFISSPNITITDNGNGTFTWTAPGAGATKLSQLSDVKITEPALVDTLNLVTNVSPTVLTVNAASPVNLSIGDWIRGDNTENGYVTQVLDITSNTVTLATTDGFGFSTAIWKVGFTTLNGYGLVWDNASNAFITKKSVQSITANGDTGAFGDVNFVAGTNTTVVRNNNNFQINSTGGTGGSVSVNTVTVANPNFLNNPLALGTDYTVTGSNIAAAVRDADVSAIADRQDAANIGSATFRTRISGGVFGDAVIISQVPGNPVQLTIKTVSSSGPILAILNALGADALTISSTQTLGQTILVASYSALVFEIVATFPAATTIAQVRAIFSPGGVDVRSDQVWYGGVNTGRFTFQPLPRQAIASQFVAGANITLTPDATNQVTIASTGGSGGSTTLQGLTDVAITEPVFAQVGTATVVSISSATTSIVVTSAAGIAVGDWLRGGSVMPLQVPALQVIAVVGTLVEFNLDPTPFFVVGNFIYRLPGTLEGARLQFSNALNKWNASPALNSLPMDTISWVSLAGDPFVSVPSIPIQVAPITTNVLDLVNPWTFGLPTLPGFTSNAEVCGVDALGRQVTGQYVSAQDAGQPNAILEFIKADRVSGGGFVINNTYPLTWRQGAYSLPDYVRFNRTTNAITQGLAAVNLAADGEIARLIGSGPAAYSDSGTTTVTTGFGNVGTTANVIAGGFATLKAFLQTAAIGAVPVASGLGDWTLPTWSIRISNVANPTAAQFATVSRITENTSTSLLQVAFSGNQTYFANAGLSAQSLFFIGRAFVFQADPQAEIVRLAQVNDVSSLNSLQRAVTIGAGTGIAVATNALTNQILVTNTGSGSNLFSNSTSYDSTQSADNPMFAIQTNQGAVSNAVLVGMPLRMATSFDQQSTGGDINNVFYVNSGNTVAQRGINFPVSVNPFGDFRVATSFGAFIIDITFVSTSGDARNGDVMFAGAWFARASLGDGTASDPRINGNLHPLFDNLQGAANEGRQLSASLPPYIISRVAQLTPSASSATYRYTVSASYWVGTGFARNFVGSSQEYHPYLEIDEVGSGAVFISAATFVGQNVAQQPITGGIELLLGVPGASGAAGALSWDVYSVACRYNDAFTPVTGVSATFTVPVATLTGTVHNYFRYSATGAFTSIFRFVPDTDSVLTTLSYDSFWSAFSSNTLSNLITQRGQF